MMGLFTAIFSTIILGLCLYAGLLYVRQYRLRYELYREHANVFYEAADRLLDNPNTPDDVILFVNEMNETINFRDAAFVFSIILWKNRRKKKSRSRKSPRFDLRSLPDDVVADFVITFEHWIEAMAYRGMGWGPIFKALLDTPLVEEKAKTVANRLSKAKFAVSTN